MERNLLLIKPASFECKFNKDLLSIEYYIVGTQKKKNVAFFSVSIHSSNRRRKNIMSISYATCGIKIMLINSFF